MLHERSPYHSQRAVFFLWCQRQPHRDVRCREVFCHTGSDRHSVRLYCCSCTPSSRVRFSQIPRQQNLLLNLQNDQSGGGGGGEIFWGNVNQHA